jgi:hypothetical protein
MANSSRAAVWVGRILSALVVVGLAFSASFKLRRPPEVVDSFVKHYGYPDPALGTLGVVEIACAALYAIPQTSVLGAILVTGYLGGATATHVRVAEAFLPPLILGVMAWAGLYLRDGRLRALIPLRSRANPN